MTTTLNPLWITACNAACLAAHEAWRKAIQPYYRGQYEIFEKAGDGPATDADRQADRLIVETLSRQFPEPEYGYLTEESEDRFERLGCKRVWIIDPIDGTKEFIAGTGNFVVQIGLVEQMEDGLWQPVVGVAYRPVMGKMYWGIKGQGAWRRDWPGEGTNGRAPQPALDLATGTPLAAERIFVTQRDRISSMRSVLSNTHSTSRLVKLIQSLNLESYWHIGSHL
jgi:3'-phosphoadenosine 5'-phosphosulfate (PAPS) 3'-phosphatase